MGETFDAKAISLILLDHVPYLYCYFRLSVTCRKNRLVFSGAGFRAGL